ncbi:hypothetical protein [uncultured Methylobacterium sp.]|uniref:hypothetical protein n=1 Tax=uncultured Methylobacterium sp. TaxID=157278 RepID=UPI0035CC2F56
MRALAGLAVLLAASTAEAQPRDAGEGACGGNAYSSAEVTEGRRPRHGPLTAVPDTLCADIEAPPPVRIELYGATGRDSSASGLGGRGPAAPYAAGSRRGARPPGD